METFCVHFCTVEKSGNNNERQYNKQQIRQNFISSFAACFQFTLLLLSMPFFHSLKTKKLIFCFFLLSLSLARSFSFVMRPLLHHCIIEKQR
jgi:hypothetical protein